MVNKWSTRSEQQGRRLFRHAVLDGHAAPVTCAEVLRLWQEDAEFRSFFIALLADTPFEAFRWETPPLTFASVQLPFEMVILDRPGLAPHPDPGAFAAYFPDAAAEEGVVAFPNLGGDAVLVVPCPCGPPAVYRHLAVFLRQAPEKQKHALWKLIGATVEKQLGPKPVWLSTAGAGVPWLHVRIDQRPKYYGYQPYCQLV